MKHGPAPFLFLVGVGVEVGGAGLLAGVPRLTLEHA